MTSKNQGLMEFLTRTAPVLPEETVRIEEWGNRDIVLRGMTSRERDLFEERQLRRGQAAAGNGAATAPRGTLQADLTNFRARLVAAHIVEGGMRTFANPKGEELLGDQPARILDKLFAAAQRLSGFSQQDLETLAKNSGSTPGDEPSSDSPGGSESQSVN